jgi:hypothetical protein
MQELDLQVLHALAAHSTATTFPAGRTWQPAAEPQVPCLGGGQGSTGWHCSPASSASGIIASCSAVWAHRPRGWHEWCAAASVHGSASIAYWLPWSQRTPFAVCASHQVHFIRSGRARLEQRLQPLDSSVAAVAAASSRIGEGGDLMLSIGREGPLAQVHGCCCSPAPQLCI